MGALEYIPAVQTNAIKEALEISHLVEESRLILQGDIKTTIPEIMEAGGSAGGARAKAIIQYNHNTNHIISGRATPKKGYEHYIVKFDGISPSGESEDYTKIEYIYMQIASMCGLDVASVETLEDRNYLHLLIKRFDRVQNHKIHMHSLCGMTHSNFNQSGAFSYEEYLKTVQIVTQKRDSVIRAYAHMVFNVIASNQDDHTKNFSFLMDSFGQWDISPIYDLTFSHGSGYTSKHQLTINGKQTDFILDDLLKVAKTIEIDTKEAKMIIEYIQTTFYDNFEKLAYDLNVNQDRIKRILSLTRRFDIT
jgi:serine/threonine-protein kinase HipA